MISRRSGTEDGAINAVLDALADPMRRTMLDLVANGNATATTLAGQLPISRQAVAKHLAVLESAGLIVSARKGREVHHHLAPGPLNATSRWMQETARDWDRRLHHIKNVAEGLTRDANPTTRRKTSP